MATKSKSESLRKFGDLLMNEKGEEVPSNVSLTTTIRLPSLGDRVQRYMRTPQLEQDRYRDPSLWDDESVDEFFETMDDGSLRPVSPHTDSYRAALDHRKKRLSEEESAARDAAAKKAAEENAAFRKRVREAREDVQEEQDVKPAGSGEPAKPPR